MAVQTGLVPNGILSIILIPGGGGGCGCKVFIMSNLTSVKVKLGRVIGVREVYILGGQLGPNYLVTGAK